MSRYLADIAREAKVVIDRARADGLTIDDGNVIDLLADNMAGPTLLMLRDSLKIAHETYGEAYHFPKAEKVRA
jgi:hypothetical protein